MYYVYHIYILYMYIYKIFNFYILDVQVHTFILDEFMMPSFAHWTSQLMNPLVAIADGCRLDKAHIVCASTHGHMWRSWPCFLKSDARWGKLKKPSETSNRSPTSTCCDLLRCNLLNIFFLHLSLRRKCWSFHSLDSSCLTPGYTTGGKTASSANFEVVRWCWVTKTATQRQE